MEGINTNNEGVKVTKEMVLEKLKNSKGTGFVQFPFGSDLSLVKDCIFFEENLENNSVYKVPREIWVDKTEVKEGTHVFQKSGDRVYIKNPLFSKE